ncbi:MAG: hypothetical protein JJ896_06230 [Rhodothermales bacterium]|nr:hypothetical protein [Rhodothermales bacterium]MBO6779231.1 hypothetical protein [Rhodothermales bacterium]
MADLSMRPRIEGHASGSLDSFLGALNRGLSDSSSFVGTTYEKSAVIKIREQERHFWSPQLHLSLESDGDEVEILGLFSPHPTVWSAFMAAYMALAFLGIMGVTIGASQYLLGNPPFALWAGPAALLLGMAVYLAARFGRSLGSDQMRAQLTFLREATAFSTEPLSTDS